MEEKDESTLQFFLTGSREDIEFIRARAHGVLVDLVEEADLGDKIIVDWEWA